MKNLVLAALIALSSAPAAFASSNNGALSATDAAAVHSLVPGADLSNLSAADAGAISAALYSSDRQSEAGQQIRSILLNSGSTEASRTASVEDAPYATDRNDHNDR